MNDLIKEQEFTLPIGYLDPATGETHKQGVMRLATAGDGILPLMDRRVQSNPAYLSIIVLSKVITKLGTLDMVNTYVIESLFSADFAFLLKLYKEVNGSDIDPCSERR